TARTTAIYRADMDALGNLPPDKEPRATQYIPQMIALIERLVKGGNAYIAEDHVLFSVPSMPDYGKLSHRSLDEMIAGARVEVAPYKKDATDFVLWKPSKPSEPAWPSPGGIKTPGRPGWHIECSAMSWKHLGETFDIHGGGIDLAFPHHENEIAQSRCAFHTPVMANTWMHNGFLQVEGEKMSKSLGNFVTIHELLQDWPGEVVRLNMLRTHYRQPMDWTVKGLEESQKVLDGWYEIVGDDTAMDGTPDTTVIEALRDDLNTPNVVTALHQVANRRIGTSGLEQIERKRALRSSAAILGLLTGSRRDHLAANPRRRLIDEDKVNRLIDARRKAREAKQFAAADNIRDELAAMGVVLNDSKDGTTWEIAR
ncbi:MAG: cysteine--tRNA ligase, partial [Pseudolabrys sp.]|nr:cysteine--tRNA ligase [Pseudolabrys sp.]